MAEWTCRAVRNTLKNSFPWSYIQRSSSKSLIFQHNSLPLLSYIPPMLQTAPTWNGTYTGYKNSLKAALWVTGFFFGWAIAMTKLWEKPPFSYTVKENVGGGTGLSFSTWVWSGYVAKRKEEDSLVGQGWEISTLQPALQGQASDGVSESVIVWLSMFLSHKREVTYAKSRLLALIW